MVKKTANPKSPDKLAQTGKKKAGVELSESQLGQVSAGLMHKFKEDTLK